MIHLTSAAAVHLQKQIQDQGGVGINFGVRGSGCSGFAYTIEVAQHAPITPDWTSCESQGVQVWVNLLDLPLVEGTTIDWQKQGLNQRLVFANGRETARCGCGESFSV